MKYQETSKKSKDKKLPCVKAMSYCKKDKLLLIKHLVQVQSIIVDNNAGIRKQAGIIQEKLPKIYSKELVELLFMNPYIKIEFLEKHLGITRQTASKYLKQLSLIGLLEEQKIGKYQ